MGFGGFDDDDRALPLDLPELVAVDMDGTLLNSKNALSERVVEAVQQATAKGVRVVLCSARPPRSMARFYSELGLKTLQINHNGAMIFDPVARKVMMHKPMAAGLAREVVDLAMGIEPTLAVGVEVVDRLYTHGDLKAALRKEPSVGAGKGEVEGSLDESLAQAVSKLLILGQAQSLGEIQMALCSKMGEQVEQVFSHQHILQVVAGGVSKAAALEKVAKRYGVPREQVMAIGDAPNDTSMLRWAGLAVAMGNAWEDTRKMADFVVPSNDEDGVAVALERYVIGPRG